MLHAERDEQYAESLAYLREGNQNIGMLYSKGIGKLSLRGKAADEGIGIAIGNLKTHTKQH